MEVFDEDLLQYVDKLERENKELKNRLVVLEKRSKVLSLIEAKMHFKFDGKAKGTKDYKVSAVVDKYFTDNEYYDLMNYWGLK